MNPIPVVIDKVLLPLELYSAPLPSLVLSIYGIGEFLQTLGLGCDGLPLWHNRYSSPYTRAEPLCFAAALHQLVGLGSGKAIPT